VLFRSVVLRLGALDKRKLWRSVLNEHGDASTR